MRITVHVHPTEVIDKVKQSLATLLVLDPAALDGLLDVTVVDGDYGNKIDILTVMLKAAGQVKDFLQRLKDALPDDHKRLIREHFDSLYNPDNNTLYIRFHKQLAFQGQLRVSQYDDILHTSIKFTAYTRRGIGEEGTNILKFLHDQGIIA